MWVVLPGKSNGLISIAVSVTGTWVYQINSQEQENIKRLVSGKKKQASLHLLLSLPGVREARIEGIDDKGSIPTNTTRIHIAIVVSYQPPASQGKISTHSAMWVRLVTPKR